MTGIKSTPSRAFSVHTDDAHCIFCLDQCTRAFFPSESSQFLPPLRHPATRGLQPFGGRVVETGRRDTEREKTLIFSPKVAFPRRVAKLDGGKNLPSWASEVMPHLCSACLEVGYV